MTIGPLTPVKLAGGKGGQETVSPSARKSERERVCECVCVWGGGVCKLCADLNTSARAGMLTYKTVVLTSVCDGILVDILANL